MGRTTDEWAALLDGATEGPWNAGKEWIYGPYYAEVLTAETATRGSGYMSYEVPLLAGDRLARDLPLAAAAPDAVAEVIRLRRALEEQRDRFRSHAKADSYLAKSSTVPLVPFYGDQARLLDRILNGDTDD